MNRNKLRLVVEEGHDFKKIKIVDENYTSHGESIHFKDGNFIGELSIFLRMINLLKPLFILF